MKFTFDLQRFDEVAISAGDTYALDGVTYTALEDARLNLDDDGKVSGLASGLVTATVTGKSNPVATVDASNGAINFAATGNGSVLTVTRPFSMELISGEFNYAGNTLTTSAGARLAFVSTLGDYSLRDESVYESGATFTFTNTALNIDSAHTTSVYTLTKGSDVKRIQIETFGPVVNNYTQRGFTLLKGSSEALTIGNYTVTATALDDATLNLELGANGVTVVPATGDGSLNVALSRNDTEIISGELNVTSGKITFGYDNSISFAKDTSFNLTQGDYVLTATTTDEAQISIALQGNKLVMTPGENDGGLNLLLTRGGVPVFGGELNVTDGTISFDATTQKVSITDGTNVSIALPNGQEFGFKVTGGDASIKATTDGAGNFILTPDANDGSLDITLKQGGQTTFYNNISVSGGSITIGNMGQVIGVTKGTTANVTLGNYTISATATDDASFTLGIANDGSIALTPAKNDGSLNVVINRDGTPIFANTVSVDGTIGFNPATQAMTLADGTSISLSFGNYDLTATANGNATSALSITGNGIAITPNTGDGSLDITLSGAGGSMNANIEVLSGSFILSEGGAITVTKGTELQIDFGNGYIINFKATDDAGGSLALGADGITFLPGSNDGGLQLSVTRDGETRTANLDVTGAVTYKLDGSISLAQGTVVRNVFDSGNVLTITANTDASGSMIFTPNNGLTVTPSTPDALTVVLTNSDGLNVVRITSIDGSINYTGGVITASDGTQAHLMLYDIWETALRTDGGSASLQFTDDRTVYTANEGATFVLDYLDGSTVEIQNGSFSDIYATETQDAIELITAGSTFRCNDEEFVFTLEKAGNYTLNGNAITTTKDGVQVQISNYDTISFEANAGIVFDGQEFSGDGIITLTDGAIVIENTDDNVAVDGTAFNDRITNIGSNVTINALGGNDTIYSSSNGAMIDGGAGNNLVSLDGGEGSNIVFSGNTTVEGFKTGWGNGSDTVYVNTGSDPGVDFKTNGLTFYDGNDSLTLADVDDTAKINLYYEASDTIARNVYIAQNDWYTVSDSDLTVDSGEGIYFVGTSATHNHGVDFSGVSQALNVTMNTDYDATNNSIWVNNVYSIRGGAGNTTITGTPDSDTIIAGTGRTTIDGAGGADRISLGSAQALVKYNSGGGSDSIYGFNANSTMSIGGAAYSSATSGGDLILNVGSDYVTLFGAASLSNPHIIGTASGGGSSSTTSGGGSSSTTSGGGSSSTTSGGSSSSTTSGGSSSSTTSGGGSSSTISGGSSSSTNRTYYGNNSSYAFRQNDHSTTANASTATTTSSQEDLPSLITRSTTSTSTQRVYTGGDQVITNYTSGSKITLGTYPTGGAFVNGNFVLSSADGSLVVQNAAGKVVDFTDGNGNDFIKAYEATAAGVVDGRGLAGFELINGSAGNDWIYAGDGGSSLWGGAGNVSDMLVGGAGTDIFVGGKNQGADVISNAETKDIINISDATLSDIIATVENNGLIAVTFNNGNAVAVQSSEALSAAFTLADGSAYRYNHATKGWQNA